LQLVHDPGPRLHHAMPVPQQLPQIPVLPARHPDLREGSRAKRWYGHYYLYTRDEAGKEIRHHVGVSLGKKANQPKWEAEQELRKIIARATGSQPRKDGAVTLEWFTQVRFIPMREGRWRPATKRGNLYDINHYILPTLGALSLKSIDKFQVASLLNHMAKTYSEPVVARTRVMLSGILEEAVDQEYIDKNPARKVSLRAKQAGNLCCHLKHYADS
jgi:hypothetical protein